MLSNKGLLIEDNVLRAKLKHKYNTLINNLTIKTPQIVGKDKIIKLYKYIGTKTKYVLLPRHYVTRLNDLLPISNLMPLPKRREFELNIKLYANQITIIDHLMSTIYTKQNMELGISATTLNFGAGLGKTFVAAGMIDQLSVNTIFVTPTKFLQTQSYDDLKLAFPKSTILKYDNANDYDNIFKSDITLIVVNSLMILAEDKDKISKLCQYFSFIIFDEVHKYCSVKRSEIFWNFNLPYALGLSATTGERLDGFDVVYEKHVGKTIIAAKDIPHYDDNGVRFDCTVKAIRYNAPAEYSENIYSKATGMIFIPGMIKQLIEDPFRLNLIVSETEKLYKIGKNIYIFSEYTEYLDKIKDALIKQDSIIADTVFILKGGAKEAEMKQTIRQARIILTTYGYSGTGISIIRMDAAIFATPRVNGYKQICARIMRRGSDLAIKRIFIDIIDNKTRLRNQFYGRKKSYHFYGFNIEEVGS